MEKQQPYYNRSNLLTEARSVTEGLFKNFEEFNKFNKNTFHENYHSELETLISQIEPTHFTKRNPALMKITEQAYSALYDLKEFCRDCNDLFNLFESIHKVENTNPENLQNLVQQLENVAILSYNQKEKLLSKGYSEKKILSLLTIVASVRKEFSEKKSTLATEEMHEKVELLQKELKRIKVAANIIFATRPGQLRDFSLRFPGGVSPQPS